MTLTLPIDQHLENIKQTLQDGDTLVLQADPGAGKSTAVPLHLLKNLDLQSKSILMLEPRRLAAKSIANYLASCLGEKVGHSIGYQVKNDRKITANTRLEIITEGILTRRLQQDPELENVGLIIFDEFHERSIHADLGLTLCKDIREGFNDNLKILVMSATIDTQQISQFLNGAPVLISEGRCFPVDTHYLPKPLSSTKPRDWLPALQQLILKAYNDHATDEEKGDMLVFLPGQAEIRKVQTWINALIQSNETVVCPLYGSLPAKAQQQALALDPQGRRKIVLATNIAETSLTIANISAVVDSGFEKRAEYDVSSGMTKLAMQRISLASANQRQGRAGRVQAGSCYRLWSLQQHKALADFTPEEIVSTDLTAFCLELVQWGVADYHSLQWLTAPPAAHISAAFQLLTTLGLVSDNKILTNLGKQAVKLGVSPRFASLLVGLKARIESKTKASDPALLNLAIDLVAVLSEVGFAQQNGDADLVDPVMILQAVRQNKSQACKEYQLKQPVVEQVLKTVQNLSKALGVKQEVLNLSFAQLNLGELVARAFPDRVAKQRKANSHRYQLTNGKGAQLAEFDKLRPTPWLAIADLDGQRNDGRIYKAVEIDAQTVEEVLGFKNEAFYHYDAAKNEIIGKQTTHCGQIILSESKLLKQDKQNMKACLQETIISSHLALLPWKPNLNAWLARVNWLASHCPAETEAWPSFTQEALESSLDDWLLPYIGEVYSVKALQNIDLTSLLKARFPYELMSVLDEQAPENYTAPSGLKVSIDYSEPTQAVVSVVLQEVFGELSSPKLAWGKVSLSFELLSPARRPIQKTSDLANFWRTSYFEVIKDMKGQYKRHRWPDKPLEEKPGKSYQPRKPRK